VTLSVAVHEAVTWVKSMYNKIINENQNKKIKYGMFYTNLYVINRLQMEFNIC